MATYISLVNYTEQGVRGIKDAPKRLNKSKKLLKSKGCKLKAFYLTLGAYDIVSIIEAPNDVAAAQVALALASEGNVRTTTLKAFDEAEFRKVVAGV